MSRRAIDRAAPPACPPRWPADSPAWLRDLIDELAETPEGRTELRDMLAKLEARGEHGGGVQ